MWRRRARRRRAIGWPAARENVARLRAGCASRGDRRRARARRGGRRADRHLEKAIADATVTAPIAGIVTEKLADAGELLQPRAPIVVITDLDHAWANVYVDEPVVPRLRVGQAATVFTDAGGPAFRAPSRYISSKAEFTPRNVQTAEDRSKLVYRVKVAVDNTSGVLKVGMPVEAEIPFARHERDAIALDRRRPSATARRRRSTSCRCRSSAARCSG